MDHCFRCCIEASKDLGVCESGTEGGDVEQGLGVGGKVGGCSGAGVGGENHVGREVNWRRTSENICVACCRTGVGGSTGGSPKLKEGGEVGAEG